MPLWGAAQRRFPNWTYDAHHESVDYKGYNGSIGVEGDQLRITHSGLLAKASGQASDQPRVIPLQAVSSVAFKEATRIANGWITLGLGGAEAPKLGSTGAPSDPNTVMFRYKEKDPFGQLHDWLITVVERNRIAGVDSASVHFDQAPREVQREAKMSQMVGEDRPDVVAAAARMNWRMGGKRELKKLASHLHVRETVRFIAQGTYDAKQGILVLTDMRLLFLFHGLVGQAKEDFPLRLISSLQTKSGLLTGELRVHVSGNNAVISGIVKNDLEPLANAIRQGMAEQNTPATAGASSPVPAGPTSDPFEALQKLASLRDAGILSAEEFEAKKQELLNRM